MVWEIYTFNLLGGEATLTFFNFQSTCLLVYNSISISNSFRWYKQLFGDKTIILCSNMLREYKNVNFGCIEAIILFTNTKDSIHKLDLDL